MCVTAASPYTTLSELSNNRSIPPTPLSRTNSHDYLNIMRLANKFCIHSLLIEDLLKLKTQKAKITAHSGNNFVVFPTLRLSRETERALKAWGQRDGEDGSSLWRSSTPPFPIRLEEATAGVLAVGAAGSANEQEDATASAQTGTATGDTVITIRTTWRAVSPRTGQMDMPKEFAVERGPKAHTGVVDSMVRQLNPMAALRRMGVGSSVPSLAATPSSGASGATSNSSQTTSTNTTSAGTDAETNLTDTTRRRNLMMATMRQGLRRGLSSTAWESGLERKASGGAVRGASKPLRQSVFTGPGQFSSISLKDLSSPRRRALPGGASGPVYPTSSVSSPDTTVGKGGVAKVRVLPEKGAGEEDDNERWRRIAQAEEWEKLSEQDDENGDDGASLTSEAEEDDWYFDSRMMVDVAESVYQVRSCARCGAIVKGTCMCVYIHIYTSARTNRRTPPSAGTRPSGYCTASWTTPWTTCCPSWRPTKCASRTSRTPCTGVRPLLAKRRRVKSWTQSWICSGSNAAWRCSSRS